MPKRSMGFDADGVVEQGVVVVLDPEAELAVECFQRREVELADENWSRTRRKKRSILPLAAASRTAVWRRMQPTRRAQI